MKHDDIIAFTYTPSRAGRNASDGRSDENEVMRVKLIVLFCSLVLFAGLSGGYVVGGMQAYARYRQNSFAAQEHCGGQSPVHICVQTPSAIYSAFYSSDVANHMPLFQVQYSSDQPLTLAISVTVVGLSQTQVQTLNATAAPQTANFMPPLNRALFRQLTTEDNTSLRVQATDMQNRQYYLDDIPLLLHSRWLMQWAASNRLQIAAWVTPNDPAIGALVYKAEEQLPSEPAPTPAAMIGYNKASAGEVMAQVDAIYDTLLDYHIRYVQASVPYSGPDSNAAATQIIKLPSEVLAQRSGMCIELTLLLASAVERIGLHAEIIIVPGHAFLGVATTPDNRHFAYWDAVQLNNNVAGASDAIISNAFYAQNLKQHTILDTILISDARAANINAML